MRTFKDLVYGPYATSLLDLFLPDSDSFPLFIYFHGGGLEAGTRQAAEPFVKDLTDAGIAVASVEYRMYPTAHFPEFILDAAESVAYLQTHIDSYGHCEGIYPGGSSAGGYLSMMLCFDDHYLRDVGVDPDSIAGYVHDAGQPTSHFNVLREKNIDTRRVIVDETAPLFFVGTRPDYPRMIFIVSDQDMENRPEQTTLMLSTLKHFRYDMDKIQLRIMHGTHCAYCSAMDSEGHSIFGKIIKDFILHKPD